MPSGQRGRLPTELYREIVQHIQCRADILSLLTVSHLLSNEAERLLYRSIVIQVNTKRGTSCQGEIRASRFSYCKRVGHHVRSATLSGIGNAIVEHVLVPILLSLTNVKALALDFTSPDNHTPFVYFLKGGNVPFHLLELTIHDHKGDDALVSFLRSQSTLRKLLWTCSLENIAPISLSPSDLPHLTTFTTNHPSLINLIIPGRNVKLLDYCMEPYYSNQRIDPESGTSYLCVQAMALSTLRNLGTLPILFPNLQYLFLRRVYLLDKNLLPHLNLFKHLNRLKLVIYTDITSCRALASTIFACNRILLLLSYLLGGNY